MKKPILFFITLFTLMLCVAQAATLPTAFTYQGRLSDNGQPANGIYDLRFSIFDAANGGALVAGPLTNSATSASNGLFTVTLDFGGSVFDGNTRWLEIEVETSGTTSFTTLSPRQPLTPAPSALFAVNSALAATATTASSVAASAVSPTQLNTTGAPASGQVLAFNGTGLVWTNPTSASAWSLNGNTGTVPGVNFLGTTDDQPFELQVNGARALRLEPTGGTPNLIGGSQYNHVAPGTVGAAICGGGQTSFSGLVYTNFVAADFAIIGCGVANAIMSNATYSVIGGGIFNDIQTGAQSAFIGGGSFNTIWSSANATICGGWENVVGSGANGAAISGGRFNGVNEDSEYSTIAGGSLNLIGAMASFAAISGGVSNTVREAQAAIGGGANNTIEAGAAASTISGGAGNTIPANSIFGTIPGGYLNRAADHAFAAGTRAKANDTGSFIWGDSTAADFASDGDNEFAVRATGGVRFVSSVDISGAPVAGVRLFAGSGSWSSLSDRNAKTNFGPVNSRQLLDRLAQLPIQTWNYKNQSESVRHIGPVAQDFADAFNVGEDDRHIATVDEGGVALAAIQGLNEIVREKDAEIQDLKKSVTELKELVTALTRKENGGAQ
jgi:trimeric autotransporter adhesin